MPDVKKIIMIDDQPELCNMVKMNLEETGHFAVVTESDPANAEALCQQEAPDIILLDNVMPGLKGMDVVKKLKKIEALKKVPIIMVSGKGEMVYLEKKKAFHWEPNNPAVKDRGELIDSKNPEVLAEGYGVDDYVSKPFTTEVLIGVINEVLDRYKEKTEDEEEDISSF